MKLQLNSNIGAYVDGASRTATGIYVDYFYTPHPSSNTSVYIQGKTQATASIDNVSCVRIGCVAEYDGTGAAGDKWLDKSGNDLHGTITNGVTLENTPADADNGLVYEEGTWTGTYVSSGASFSYTQQAGTYTRIGRVVHFDLYMISNSASGGTAGNAVYIGGLPYTCASSKYSFGSIVVQATQWNGDYPTHGLVVQADTTVHLHYRDYSDGEGLALRYDDMKTGTSDNYIAITGYYHI